MAKEAEANGCAWLLVVAILFFAIGKCSGGSTPTAEADAASEAVALFDQPTVAETAEKFVVPTSLNCRAEPRKRAEIVTKFSRADSVTVGETKAGWSVVGRADRDCWVRDSGQGQRTN